MKDNKQIPQSRQGAKKVRKRHRWLVWILSFLGVCLVGAGLAAGYVYFQTKKAMERTYAPDSHLHIKNGEFNGRKKFAVLLMGTDTGALDRTDKRGNTDTLILVIVNPQKHRYTLMSIPRDTMAQMIGAKKFTVDKINAAYQLGGAKMTVNTVSHLIKVPVKYYAIINMGGIIKMIHYVGGLNMRPLLTFSYGGYDFKKGRMTHFDGGGALAYTRMRYQDPQGDYGREKRQRQVITTLVKKALTVNSLTNLTRILDSLAHNIRTNLPFDVLEEIAINYRSSATNVHNDYLHGYNAIIDGGDYQVQPTAELQRVCNYCRKELGLPAVVVNNNETYQNQRNVQAGFSFKSTKNQKYHIYNDYAREGRQ